MVYKHCKVFLFNHWVLQTEAQLSAAEEVCGPYVWGVYDLLVLPPSFPFGGMENPCLTFVTPTMIVSYRVNMCFCLYNLSFTLC